MSEPVPADDDRIQGGDPGAHTVAAVRANRMLRRQRRIRDEIARNRRGEYRIPTWVLAVALVAVVAAWAALILLA